MSTQHTRKDRHLMWTDLGDLWEQAQGYLAMLALTLIVGSGAILFGLAIGEAAGKAPALAFSVLVGLGLVFLVVWRWRVAGQKLDAILRDGDAEAARARVTRALELLDAPPGYAEIFDRHVGRFVCTQCGAPVEAEPCPVHGPAAAVDSAGDWEADSIIDAHGEVVWTAEQETP